MLVQGRCSFVRLMAWVDLDLGYKRRVLLGKIGKTGSSFVWCGFCAFRGLLAELGATV
jgi:hypothetical protein